MTKEKEISELSKEFFLSAGETNAEQEISLPLLTSKIIDIATEHANLLGIGNPSMVDKNTGWVLSRLTIEMREYPSIDENYILSTWVESWNRHFSERAFCIKNDSGAPNGFARSVWMVLNTETHSNAGLQGLNFSSEYIKDNICPISRQSKHCLIVTEEEAINAKGQFLIADKITEHVFKYSDLDAYRHVNTVRYVQLLMNQFSLETHDLYYVSRLELAFLNEGKYDEKLEILRHFFDKQNIFMESGQSDKNADNDSMSFAFLLRYSQDHTPVLFSKIYLKKRNL